MRVRTYFLLSFRNAFQHRAAPKGANLDAMNEMISVLKYPQPGDQLEEVFRMFLTHLTYPSPIDSQGPPPNELLALRGMEAVLLSGYDVKTSTLATEVSTIVLQSLDTVTNWFNFYLEVKASTPSPVSSREIYGSVVERFVCLVAKIQSSRPLAALVWKDEAMQEIAARLWVLRNRELDSMALDSLVDFHEDDYYFQGWSGNKKSRLGSNKFYFALTDQPTM